MKKKVFEFDIIKMDNNKSAQIYYKYPEEYDGFIDGIKLPLKITSKSVKIYLDSNNIHIDERTNTTLTSLHEIIKLHNLILKKLNLYLNKYQYGTNCLPPHQIIIPNCVKDLFINKCKDLKLNLVFEKLDSLTVDATSILNDDFKLNIKSIIYN